MTTWSLTPLGLPHELDILEIRLAELDPVVDVHVISESTLTYSGEPKPLYVADNWNRIERWERKIRYVVVNDSPQGVDAHPPRPELLTSCTSLRWAREVHQREALTRGTAGMARDDLVLMSDLDEVPRAVAFPLARDHLGGRHSTVVRPPLGMYIYHLNWRWVMPAVVVCGFCTGNTILSMGVQGVRTARAEVFGPQAPGPGLGWHISYVGGLDVIKYKLRVAAHHEVDTPPYNTDEWIKSCLTTGRDLFGRYRPVISVGEHELPAYVQGNRDRFEHLLGPELPALSPDELAEVERVWIW